LMVLGSPGGPKIITAVAQVLLRTLVLGQTLEDAVAAPRLHQQWAPSRTLFEAGWDAGLLSALETNRAHVVEVSDQVFGSVQAISIDKEGRVVGVSDPRRGGVAGVEGQPIPYPARRPKNTKAIREADPEPATQE